MARTVDEILDSVVLITGTVGKKFGTGFAIQSKHNETYILTCAHVVEDVGGDDNIEVESKLAKVVACGSSKAVDLAVLKVQDLDIPVLKLELTAGEDIADINVVGFAKLAGDAKRAEVLKGRLGGPVIIKASEGSRAKAWRLWITGKTLLEGGYSGSPVIDVATNRVFAVASHSEYKGEGGYAVSLAHLQDVWPELLSEWRNSRWQTSEFRDPSNHQRRFIPILQEDCKIPDTLRRYLYIDFRKTGTAPYQQLLNACLGKPSSSSREYDPESKKPSKSSQEPRLRAADLLNQLLPAQFQEVVFRYPVAPQYLPQGVAQSQQAITVIQYAIQQEGEALTQLLQTIGQVAPHLMRK